MNISRRSLLTASAGLGMVTLAGCGSPSDATSSAASGSGGTVNLIMSNHPWQRAIEPLFPQFTEETGIAVNVQTFAEQQMRDKILLNLQSKSDAMDVYMSLPSREGVQFSDAGYYQPLDDYFASTDGYDVDDFTPGSMEAMQQGGATIAVPINVEGPIMFYRTDVFSDLGIDVPTTMDELLSACAKIQSDGDGMIPITLRGVSGALPYTYGPFFHGNGLDWTTDGKPNFDQPGAVSSIETYAQLASEYGPPGVINYSFTESSNLFAQGKVAIELESSNELSAISDPDSSSVIDNIGCASYPAGTASSVPTVLSWGLSISPFGANTDAAWQFVSWATSMAVQLELTSSGIASPRTSVVEDESYQATLDSDTKKQWQEALTYLQENGSAEVGPVGKDAVAMRKVIGDGVGAAILGESDAQQAADTIQQGLEPLLQNG